MDTDNLIFKISILFVALFMVRTLFNAKKGFRIRKELKRMDAESQERTLAELKRQNDPAYKLCIEPLPKPIAFLGQSAAVILICILFAVLALLIFIVFIGR